MLHLLFFDIQDLRGRLYTIEDLKKFLDLLKTPCLAPCLHPPSENIQFQPPPESDALLKLSHAGMLRAPQTPDWRGEP